MSAENRFKNIFEQGILYGNPKSFFVNKIDNAANQRLEDIRSVSFALADIFELPKHFEARGSEFGICFFHNFLQNSGLRAVEYLNDNDRETNQKIIFNSPHLIEVYSEGVYDMRWEKEFRIQGDLHFSPSDIAFVIVPQDKYDYFVKWFGSRESSKGEPFEFQIITSNTYKSYLDHMLFLPFMDNGWGQINVGSFEHGGYKISPKDLPKLTTQEKTDFERDNTISLLCLAKNTILTCYEDRLTERFSNFIQKIKQYLLDEDMKSAFECIVTNRKEPHESERDLIHALYTDLHMLLSSNNRL